MKIYTIYTGLSNNYLIQADNGKVLLIDCSCSLSDLLKLTQKLDTIVITHGHFDHIATLQAVQAHFNCPVFMHSKAVCKLTNAKLNASRFFACVVEVRLPANVINVLKEGQQTISGVQVIVHNVPGHTDCSIMLEVGKAMFTGDFVFETSYGRTDLPTGDFRAMQASLAKWRELLRQYNCYYGH